MANLYFDLSNNFTAFLLPAPAVPESALPIGMEKEDGSTQLIPIEPSEILLASSPGPSQLFNVSACNIEKLGWPGDEAKILSKLELWDSLQLES